MKEILRIALDYPPNTINLGDLGWDHRTGVLTTSQSNDVVTAYDNAGRQRWVFRNDPDFETRAGWPVIQFDQAGRVIPQRLIPGSCNQWDPIVAKHPWGHNVWSNASILDGAWKGKVLTSRYRLHLLDGATGRELATRCFGAGGAKDPDPISCVDPAHFGDANVLYVSTLSSGLYCLDERLDILWHLPDMPPVMHRGFVGDVDGDGNDEYVGGTMETFQTADVWDPRGPSWFCLIDHDGKRLWRKEIGVGKEVEANDRHVDWFSIAPNRVVLAEGYIFDAAGKLVCDLRATLHGHLQKCECTAGVDGRIFFTQRVPPLVAGCDTAGRILWTYDKFKAKALHEGTLMNYFGHGRLEYVVEELPGDFYAMTPDLITYIFDANGKVLDTIPMGGMARTCDWNGDGLDEVVIVGGDGYTDLRVYSR